MPHYSSVIILTFIVATVNAQWTLVQIFNTTGCNPVQVSYYAYRDLGSNGCRAETSSTKYNCADSTTQSCSNCSNCTAPRPYLEPEPGCTISGGCKSCGTFSYSGFSCPREPAPLIVGKPMITFYSYASRNCNGSITGVAGMVADGSCNSLGGAYYKTRCLSDGSIVFDSWESLDCSRNIPRDSVINGTCSDGVLAVCSGTSYRPSSSSPRIADVYFMMIVLSTLMFTVLRL